MRKIKIPTPPPAPIVLVHGVPMRPLGGPWWTCTLCGDTVAAACSCCAPTPCPCSRRAAA